MSVDVSSCNWPIPDPTSASGRIEQCLNFAKGCWQCTTEDDECWCYMKRFWDIWGLDHGEVKVNTDLQPLHDRIDSGFQLKSNLGMSSSHDPLHTDCIKVFKQVLDLFGSLSIDEGAQFWNGHNLHICTKHPMRLLALWSKIPTITKTVTPFYEEYPIVWTSITTPSDEQAREYMRDVDSPFDMRLALNELFDLGFDHLGVSFGPLFGAWRDWEVAEAYLRTLPQLEMAQFEQMNHGHDSLDVLTFDEVHRLALRFKRLQPHCKVYLKNSTFNVGQLLEVSP